MPNTIANKGNNNLNFQDVTNSTITVQQNSIAKLPKELTLNIPKIHLNKVIGREHELEDLYQLLFDNKHVVLVNGLGGIGKTTLAQAYMSQYYDEYQHIVWISQNSEHSIESDFINTEGLKENLSIDTRGKDLPMLFNEILLKLKALTDKPNLLLIDNTETSLSKLLPSLPQQPNWHLLVTSREHIEHFYPKELGYLSPEKALALFKTHCLLIRDDQAIEELLEVIDYHTLTIEILAKTATVQRKSIAELKNAITNDLKANVTSDHNKGNKIDKVRSYLSSIFNLGKLNTHEIWLMKQLAYLPPEPHSFELLHELIAPENEYEETFAETLNELVKKGWLMHYPETDSFKMHRIIAEVTAPKLNIELEDIENLITSISQKLEIDQTKDNPIDKFQWIPFGKVILVHFENEIDSKIALLQNNLAVALQDLGDYPEAKRLLEKAMILNESHFGENHLTTTNSYSNLATVLKALGDYEEAERLLNKAIIFAENNFGENHPTTVNFYSNLATVLHDLGEYKKAKELLEKVTIYAEAHFGKKHPTTAALWSNLALVLQDLGECEKAKDFLQKAMISDEINFGAEHPTTAIRYYNLATVYFHLNDSKNAIVLLEKAYDIYKSRLGDAHPITKKIKENFDHIQSQIN